MHLNNKTLFAIHKINYLLIVIIKYYNYLFNYLNYLVILMFK